MRITPKAGKAILIPADLRDLEELLNRPEGRGIDVYTHGGIFPAHGYPRIIKKKYPSPLAWAIMVVPWQNPTKKSLMFFLERYR